MSKDPVKISSKHWEAMKKLITSPLGQIDEKITEPPKLFGIPVVVDDSPEPGEVKLISNSDLSRSDKIEQYLKQRAKLFYEEPQVYAELMGLEAEPAKPKSTEIHYCACNHPQQHHADSAGVCVLGSCSCKHFVLRKIDYVSQPLPPSITPKYLDYTDEYALGADWSADWSDNPVTSISQEHQYQQALQVARNYAQELIEAATRPAKVGEAKPKVPKVKVDVVKQRKERKLALDKDI